MSWIFWLSVVWVAYAYAGYPLCLFVLRSVRPRPVSRADIFPSLSVVVAVHDGAHQIREKLDNLLAQEYPRELVEIWVADDASRDGTDRVVTELSASGVRLVRLEQRGGKERAQQEALRFARGEIVVFTDLGTRLDPGGLRAIVRSFADPTVGCVSSTDRVLAQDGSPGAESTYVRYEMLLRRLESEAGSLVGLSGSFFAARREVCANFSDRVQSDFRTLLEAVRQGYRGVSDPDALGYYRDVAGQTSEFSRKVRTVVRGLTALFDARAMLNPWSRGLFAWQLFSHKVVRWTVPFAMLLALASSGWLAWTSPLFAALFAAQAAGYLFAGATFLVPALAKNPVGRILRYLVQANSAILVAWVRFVRGERVVAWTPSTR